MVNVEEIDLAVGNSYKLTLNDANDTGGLKIDGSALLAGQIVTVNGSAETDASLVLLGGAGNDTLSGGAKGDTLDGGAGNDVLTSGKGEDTVSGESGNDTIAMAGFLDAGDRIDGGADADTVTLAGDYSLGVVFDGATMVNVETITLGAGFNYSLTLDDATNVGGLTVNGSGLTSTSTLLLDGSTESGSVLIATGGGGADTVFGGAGNDVLTGGNGNDVLHAGSGTDTLPAGAGNDTLDLGANLDVTDKVDGGTGTDTLLLNGDYSAGVVFGAMTVTGVEIFSLAAGHDYNLTLNNATNAGNLTVDGSALVSSNSLTVDGSLETASSLTALGGAGNDTLSGGAGNDILRAGDGNDVLLGGIGRDLLDGGAGDDVTTGGTGKDTFHFDLLSDAGTGLDTVTDFTKGASGDVLDVHDLLSGLAGYNGTNAFSGGFLNFQASGGDTVVQVDADGGGNSYQTLVTLQHVTLTAADTQNYTV